MCNKKIFVESHNTTRHDGGVAISLPSGEIYSLSSERISRIKHDGDSSIAYKYFFKKLSKEGWIFGSSRDKFNPILTKEQKLHHHLGHAAGAFFSSGFDEANVLVIDGEGFYRDGKYVSVSIWKGEKEKLSLLEINPEGGLATQSIGLFYSAITYHLGFDFRQEGKIMALAAYGKESKIYRFLKKYIYSNPDGTWYIHPELIRSILFLGKGKKIFHWEGKRVHKKTIKFMKKISKIIGPSQEKNLNVTKKDKNLAWAVQKIAEEIILGIVERTKNISKSNKLCYAGGVALNSMINGKILKLGLFDEVFFFPPAGDEGQALGRLLYRLKVEEKKDPEYIMKNAYLGPDYSSKEIKLVLKSFSRLIKVSFLKNKELIKKIAKLIADGNVIGWWQGRSELGPRALGHRSILADPRRKSMRDYINLKVKNREWFRPFAPSILEEEAKEYLDIDIASPFMLLVVKVKPQKIKEIPAVVHIDNTTRPQTVNLKDNGIYYELIKEFKKITKIPALLNTSFNNAGEPIVETPNDAIKSFLKMKLDYLIIGNYLIKKLIRK